MRDSQGDEVNALGEMAGHMFASAVLGLRPGNGGLRVLRKSVYSIDEQEDANGKVPRAPFFAYPAGLGRGRSG